MSLWNTSLMAPGIKMIGKIIYFEAKFWNELRHFVPHIWALQCIDLWFDPDTGGRAPHESWSRIPTAPSTTRSFRQYLGQVTDNQSVTNTHRSRSKYGHSLQHFRWWRVWKHEQHTSWQHGSCCHDVSAGSNNGYHVKCIAHLLLRQLGSPV